MAFFEHGGAGRKPRPKAHTSSPLKEGLDYKLEDGKYVLTAFYLLKRGYCCNSGCRNCPYAEDAEYDVPDVTIIGAEDL